MNTSYKIKCYVFMALFAFGHLSCNEDIFLEEIPLDFFSPENSYRNFGDFQSALTDLYSRVRRVHYGPENVQHFPYWMSTDIAQHARGDVGRFGSHSVWVVPTNGVIAYHWNEWYKVVSNANTILSRVGESEMSEAQTATVAAEAKLFRALAYRYLVYLYGDIPLILEELTAPKTDFTRNSKVEVLNQIVLDATDAANALAGIDQVLDGKLSNLVAYHLLAETLISLERYGDAVTAASRVIDDPNTALMTDRFGVSANRNPQDEFLKFTQSGDPFWDLFQSGNQNRGSGNREAIWVAQFEIDTPGGLLQSSGGYVNALERWAAPVAFLTFRDPDGVEGAIGNGRSNYNSGGRGVSFMRNTDYFLNTLWEDDWDNDLRNAPHNIVRDFVYENPNSAYFGLSSVEFPSPTKINQDWRWYPYPSKITTPGDHPDELFLDRDRLILSAAAGATYRDRYFIRLPETYFLRAEAYLKMGDRENAAADINIVRMRSNAKPIDPQEVTLDYILDERARELVYEEPRRVTLHRTGTLVERVRRCNSLNASEIQDFHGLWPIPFSEIEANKDAQFLQNPGYN